MSAHALPTAIARVDIMVISTCGPDLLARIQERSTLVNSMWISHLFQITATMTGLLTITVANYTFNPSQATFHGNSLPSVAQ